MNTSTIKCTFPFFAALAPRKQKTVFIKLIENCVSFKIKETVPTEMFFPMKSESSLKFIEIFLAQVWHLFAFHHSDLSEQQAYVAYG